MMGANNDYMENLEQENYELKQECRELEMDIEGLDNAYTDAVNLLYDCKKVFEVY